jgi:hypothetical protein
MILIQIVYALYTADKSFDFRHGDLNMSNIMLENFKKDDTLVFKFSDDWIYRVRECKYFVRIMNFWKSNMKYPDDYDDKLENIINQLYDPNLNTKKQPRYDLINYLDSFQYDILSKYLYKNFGYPIHSTEKQDVLNQVKKFFNEIDRRLSNKKVKKYFKKFNEFVKLAKELDNTKQSYYLLLIRNEFFKEFKSEDEYLSLSHKNYVFGPLYNKIEKFSM